MSSMNDRFGRPLRISTVEVPMGHNKKGSSVVVRDAETGEVVHGIKRIVITLELKAINEAKITYFDTISEEGEPKFKTATVQNVIVDDICANEVTK
jgi:hypothetical protein